MSSSRDDLKWFGEGFDGFPIRLPEDSVEYTLYIIDSKLQDLEIRAKLREVQRAATDLTKKLLKEYIWQRESFTVDLVRENGLSLLRGRTNYGDSVEDEWLIVYLLRELSRKYPDLWIKLVDTDGEFLLIEAANVLPRWLSPEIADNRIWLHGGRLLIIPLQQASIAQKTVPVSRPLKLDEARTFIAEEAAKLIHSPAIESEAFFRIRNYPERINETLHHAIITIPRKVAYLLHQNAAHISSATEAFYLRDPIALKPLQAKDSGNLAFPPEDLVSISVKFTNIGYAQFKSQQFSTPPAWEGKSPLDPGSKHHIRAEMGMKVTCGFEMLLSDPQNQDKVAVRELRLLLEDLEAGEDQLPGDEELSRWDQQDDDDRWLDINFEDFEQELAGKARKSSEKKAGSFGEKSTQENLRRMVERFEDFLNDDAAGAEGAELPDSMDFDDDEDTESGSSSDGEDKAVSFDEKEFAQMMREMMGMPADEEEQTQSEAVHVDDLARIKKLDSDDEDSNEDNEITKVMQRMEDELNEAGALNLDPTPKGDAVKQRVTQEKTIGKDGASSVDKIGDNGNEEVNIDFNLVKNLLESYKSQAGMAGPGGNLLNMMGIQLPADADDTRPD